MGSIKPVQNLRNRARGSSKLRGRREKVKLGRHFGSGVPEALA